MGGGSGKPSPAFLPKGLSLLFQWKNWKLGRGAMTKESYFFFMPKMLLNKCFNTSE